MKQRKASSAFWFAIAFAGVAVGIHLYLTLHHLDLQYGTSDGTSICNINQQLDCDSVNTSIFSEIMGTPLALWGAATNAAVILLLLWAAATSFRNRHLHRMCFLLAATVASASILMLLISLTQLGTLCLFCMITYVCSFGLVFAVHKALGPLKLSESTETCKYLFTRGENGGFSYLVFFAMIPVAVFVFNGMLRARFGDDFKAMVQDSVNIWGQNTKFDLDTSTGLEIKDSQQGYRMTIVEFADFNCPHCRHAAPTLHAFAKSRRDVQFSFMNFPLDGNCNPAIKEPGRTCLFAKATYCGKAQGKGWEVHDWLFKNQGQFEGLDRLIGELKLDAPALKACLEATATHEAIMKQANQGKDAGVKGTPAIFVNGKLLPRGQFMPVLSEVYRTLN